MARRKRLTPPAPREEAAPETKSVPFGPQTMPDFETGPVMPFTASPAPVARVARDQAQAAALQELSDALTRAREGGRMVLEVPLEAVEAGHLIRDRVSVDEAEMESLKESLAASGQRTPIEVVEIGAERYGLISGWRRLAALRALREEGRGGDTVLAFLRHPEDRAEAYRAMVEENEIRADLSYFERARIVAKSVEAGVFEDDRAALRGLFGAASAPKRSKIGGFLPVVRALGDALAHPAALPERLGLKLARALEEDAALAGRLRDELGQGGETPEAERACLERAVAPAPRAAPAPREVEVLVLPDGEGRLVVEGPGVTRAFARRLEAWIARDGGGD